MSRRSKYSHVRKSNQVRADHVKGMGDATFRGFQCLDSECEGWIFVREDRLLPDFEIPCPRCQTQIRAGDEFSFYDYELEVDDEVVEQGRFTILADDYVEEAGRFKYCIVCSTLKLLEAFDRHGARKSGRQGECRICKRVYNSIKNQTRTTDQHREAAQRRRLYLDMAGNEKIDSNAIGDRFRNRCFRCDTDLSAVVSAADRPLDHTLPVSWLWPLKTENATLLCRECNAEKADQWPGQFYTSDQLAKLSNATGIPLETLDADPHFNPEALSRLEDPAVVDELLINYAARMEEIIRLRNRILDATGQDFVARSTMLSEVWHRKANDLRSEKL